MEYENSKWNRILQSIDTSGKKIASICDFTAVDDIQTFKSVENDEFIRI